MSLEQNKALVQRYWEEVWNQGNFNLLEELCPPELAARQRSFISKTRAAFSDSRVTILDLVAESDKVVTRYNWRAVHTAVWDVTLSDISMRVPATGATVWDQGNAIHQVAGNRIIDSWSEWTKLELAQQLRAILPAIAEHPASS
jgi:predicted ester cyclase